MHVPAAVGPRVALQIALVSVSRLAVTAQLFHAGADYREIVGGAGSAHVCSSLSLGLVLAALVSWPQQQT
jgi:hypothetical protein